MPKRMTQKYKKYFLWQIPLLGHDSYIRQFYTCSYDNLDSQIQLRRHRWRRV